MKTEPVGKKILIALTETQVAQLLDIVFSMLDSKEVDQVLGRVSPDVKKTLSRLFGAKAPVEVITSQEKNREKWNDLWGRWEDAVSEIGDEEGKYVCQDQHWEPPYFDGSALAEDLEEIAQELLPLIEEIYASGAEDKEIFINAMEDIEDNINAYPEWMGADTEGISLGSAVTRCMLKWEWMGAGSPEIFLDSMADRDDRLKLIELEEDTFIDFFVSLPENTQREMHECMSANLHDLAWKKKLGSSNSKWHKLYHGLAEKFDRPAFLEDCRSLLQENWRYGLPLVDDCLKKGNDAKAEEFIARTISSFIGREGMDVWQPDKSLLIKLLHYGYGSPAVEIIQMLEQWVTVCERSRQMEKAMSLKLQLATYRQPDQWDAVAEVFNGVNRAPFQNMANNLIAQWREFVSARNLGQSSRETEKIQGNWIIWLLEAGLDKTWNKASFYQKIKRWLEQLEDNRTNRQQEQLAPLFLLTRDLLELYELKKRYPNLYQIAANRTRGNSQNTASRQNWLRKVTDDSIVPLIINFWQREVEKCIPDPAAAEKSNYSAHAQWLATACEINQAVYRTVLAKWKIDHKKRTNLWKAIRERGLPV